MRPALLRAAVLGVSMMVCAPSSAQTLDSALLSLTQSAQKISGTASVGPAASPELAGKSQALLRQVDELDDLIGSKPPIPSSEYVLTLRNDARVLAAAERGEPAVILATVADVSADLEAKLGAARAGLGIAASSSFNVRVKVNTVRGITKADGFLVHANPMRYEGAEPMFPFGNPSSPAERQLAPGRYVIVAQKSGSDDAKQVFDIGGNGERDVALTLVVQ